jgi:hypothetical protein
MTNGRTLLLGIELLHTKNFRIHVRRTDHGNEAPFRELSEYLHFADEWFANNQVAEKMIYLASDEIAVIKEAQTVNYIFSNILEISSIYLANICNR